MKAQWLECQAQAERRKAEGDIRQMAAIVMAVKMSMLVVEMYQSWQQRLVHQAKRGKRRP